MSQPTTAPPPTAPPPPFRAPGHWLAEHAALRGAATALVEGERRLSYAEFNAQADRVAAALQRDGVKPQQAVAVCALSSIEYMVLFLGALRAGVAVAPLAPSATPQQLAGMVADAGAPLLFADASTQAVLGAVQGARRITLDGSDGGTPWAQWLQGAPATPQPVDVQPGWPFNIIYSSGTTGTPKGIVQPHGMRWAHVHRAALSGYSPDAVTLVATPLYSNTTLVVVFPTLAYGGTLVMMRKFDTLGYLQLAERHRATHTMLVPVQYQRLMDHPAFDHFRLNAFRAKHCTSAPFSAALKARVLARWPGALVEYYGMTEGGGTCVLQGQLFPHKLHTVGQPAEGHDIRLIDEDGQELPRGSETIGEVVGRSPAMMSGYHGQPGLSAQAEWFDAAGQRFIRTGDVGRFDADGFLVLMDRRKDMVISGGFNIYPSDLEAVLQRHPAVADCAVVGVPSREWGETPVAFVVRRAGHADTAEALRTWLNDQVGKTQRLAGLRLVDELPRSAIGKVLKRELRQAWGGEAG
ncbi:acyl-CoA synthetase (AMP-forming)/AMP-acid ligase II [Burkholderiales bacterium JOSHI_001]|nr:acyl-CoA synthetase (AMP-forming)/AMP-acid ligase II [Burkholderiales bacterium JOSHI_001]